MQPAGHALFNRYGRGSFGQNFYMRYSTNMSEKHNYIPMMYLPGGNEFAFFACQHEPGATTAVSDRGNPLKGGCLIPNITA